MNMYINYYKNEVNDELEQDSIGIILCADKNNQLYSTFVSMKKWVKFDEND